MSSQLRWALWQEQGFSGHDAYALSKLAMQMFTKDLAEIAKPRGITVNCLDPGTVNSKLLDAGWGMCGIDIKVLLPFLCYCCSIHLFSVLK